MHKKIRILSNPPLGMAMSEERSKLASEGQKMISNNKSATFY